MGAKRPTGSGRVWTALGWQGGFHLARTGCLSRPCRLDRWWGQLLPSLSRSEHRLRCRCCHDLDRRLRLDGGHTPFPNVESLPAVRVEAHPLPTLAAWRSDSSTTRSTSIRHKLLFDHLPQSDQRVPVPDLDPRRPDALLQHLKKWPRLSLGHRPCALASHRGTPLTVWPSDVCGLFGQQGPSRPRT